MKYYFSIIALLSFMLIGCKKKFEEGPRFSLKSANKRITGNWELQVLSINGIDSTQYYNAVFKEKCIFSISEPFRKGDYGGILMVWGKDTNKINNARLWTGYARHGGIYSETVRDTLPSYFLYPFCRSWYSETFDIRYLTDKKLILEIKPLNNSVQRLEFIKL